jgi:hypothetical protein
LVDWSGHDGMETSRRYLLMAERQLRGISPSYEALCAGVADDLELIALLDTLPAPKRQPNLLLGAVRFLGGPIDAYSAFRSFVLAEWAQVVVTMRDRRTQTNEARRCATLLPALAQIDGPLALFEVGASAGLCLQPDRYAYRYGDGPVLGTGTPLLECAVTGPVPVPTALPDVVWRAGLDLNPLDVRDDEDMRWLESLVWPEQTDRFAILRGAIETARRDPAPVHRGNLTTDLLQYAEGAPPDATLVVFHSAVVSYLDDGARFAFRALVGELAARRPTVWLSNEGPGVIVHGVPRRDGPVPFVLACDDVPLALASPHGGTLEWLA